MHKLSNYCLIISEFKDIKNTKVSFSRFQTTIVSRSQTLAGNALKKALPSVTSQSNQYLKALPDLYNYGNWNIANDLVDQHSHVLGDYYEYIRVFV